MNKAEAPTSRSETTFFLVYFLAYLLYLCWTLESEIVHWLSLVAIPLAVIVFIGRRRDRSFSLKDLMASIGVRRENLTNGMWVAALL